MVAAPPVHGETAPVLQMGAELVTRGHDVTALVGTAFADAARHTGAHVVTLTGAADFDVRELAARPDRVALKPGPVQMNWDFIHGFAAGIVEQHEAIQRMLDDDPDLVVLSNLLFMGCWPVALGASGHRPRRWVAVAANPLLIGDSATTVMGPVPGLAGDELARANSTANEQFEAMFTPTRDAVQRAVGQLGATDQVPGLPGAFYSLPDAVAALTVHEFDFPRVAPPDSLHYAGILPPRTPTGAITPSWWADLDTDTPVVVVTQGTVANEDLNELVVPTLASLAEEEVVVVAALGRDPASLGIDPPANARVADYLPFDELLPRASVLVTNGGFGATQHALACGVPVVVAGATEDKAMVAAHVAHHAVGIDLGTQTPTREQLATAVRDVLRDGSYHRAAQRLRVAYSDADAAATVESLVLPQP
ncbi:UDP:flavonoid glycosyltransferase YjiC, YdhE family [Williamsia sterculiae]|uniref:UDP:flavonoid glycosyltransferase YjiC, YdhE family n=1 Tax=Williamsia sterculiae TaxID=1344003 RepID=A0A1N7FIW5_9NOCA|nr:UDP:flavonoid glycosyltransferase YjiC, YdhE family [Williamsia sterculiae]